MKSPAVSKCCKCKQDVMRTTGYYVILYIDEDTLIDSRKNTLYMCKKCGSELVGKYLLVNKL